MNLNEALIAKVAELVHAENTGGDAGRAKAGSILAQDFIGITRANGEEEDREQYLQRIGGPPSQDLVRELVSPRSWKRSSGTYAVVRSLVRVRRQSDSNVVVGTYRNLHVFEKQDDGWYCIIWQVTSLNQPR